MMCHEATCFCFERNRQSRISNPYRGFTLLELLISLSLLIVLFGMIWGLIGMFSRSFVHGEMRSERSQIVRSITQLITDDLSCAIQDPIFSARADNENKGVRRFGLLGTSTSMRLDVVQINPFRTGTMAASEGVQAPELKTVYYDFAMFSPLGNGLVRRELDFETPSQMSSQTLLPSSTSVLMGMPNQSQTTGMSILPSSNTLPNTPSDTLSSIQSNASFSGLNMPNSAMVPNDMPPMENSALTNLTVNAMTKTESQQLELVAPEIVGCWFRYYDGKQWQTNWNSLDQKGLPVAIEVTLKMMPLADAEKLRQAPIARIIVNRPPLAVLNESITAQQTSQINDDYQVPTNPNASHVIGNDGGTTLGSILGSSASMTLGETFGDSTPSMGQFVTQQNALASAHATQETLNGLSIEDAAIQLELPTPIERHVIIRVPTTSLQPEKSLVREQPKPKPSSRQVVLSQRSTRQNLTPIPLPTSTSVKSSITVQTNQQPEPPQQSNWIRP